VIDALSFLLSTPVIPRVSVTWEGGVEHVTVSGATQSAKTRFFPRPVPSSMATGFDDTWLLFDRYLRFVTLGGKTAPHPLSAQWRGIRRASTGAVDTLALVAVVGVERILQITRDSLSQRASLTDAEAVGWGSEALLHLTGLGCRHRVVKRLEGLLKQL